MPPRTSTLRVLVRPTGRATSTSTNAAVKTALAQTRWGATRTPRCSAFGTDTLVEVDVDDAAGSPRFASRAHELVQRLYDTHAFLRAEADIPLAVFGLPKAVPAAGDAVVAGADDDCATNAAASAHDWVLTELRVAQARAAVPKVRANGLGIRIGHPDSGYSDHFALGRTRLDLVNDRDVISGDNDALDPLKPPHTSIFNLLPNPGHGTSTASCIVGKGDGAGFEGIAGGARLVPIRATESVVQIWDTDVAKAVRWARSTGCHIVSMSLGGKGLFGLQDAIQEAIDDGMIVMAAAGNKVGIVTAPASYDNCIAVAATVPGGKPWSGSSHGKAVDVSAPGSCVWTALFDWHAAPPRRIVRQSNGTSYAVAHLAGVAALWLAKHGHAALVTRYGRPSVQAAFVRILRQPGVCRRTPGWNAGEYGVGVVDAEAVVRAALPPPFALTGKLSRAAGAGDDALARMAAMGAMTLAEAASWVDGLLGDGSSSDPFVLNRFEGELVYHLLAGGTAFAKTAAGTTLTLPGSSPQFRARMRTRA